MVKKTRLPTWEDLINLSNQLNDAGVEYVLIGGFAMALHGYERATKDIDFLLASNAENIERLTKVLRTNVLTKGGFEEGVHHSLLRGISTAVSDEILVDLLFVAADHRFEQLREHIIVKEHEGIKVHVMDLDGLLITKRTTRQSDVADRLKIEAALNKVNEFSKEHVTELARKLIGNVTVTRTDTIRGNYDGAVVAINLRHIAQEIGGVEIVIHGKKRLAELIAIAVGDVINVRYSNKEATISLRDLPLPTGDKQGVKS